MVTYVLWCLDKAKTLDLERLFFLSRDGQVLLKIAKILDQKLITGLDLKYLHVSRQSLLFPALEKLDQQELDWILARTFILTPRIIFRRLNIEVENVSSLLAEHGFPKSSYDAQLSEDSLSRLEKCLLDVRLQDIILSSVPNYRKNLIQYLSQEGVVGKGKFAIIDIGWNGTLQRSLGRLLEQEQQRDPLIGFYFGLRRRLKHKGSDILLAYFADHENPLRRDSISALVPMIEAFSAADHGGVKYHEKDNGVWRPVLANEFNSKGIEWGVLVQHEAYEELARTICQFDISLLQSDDYHHDLLADNLASFLLNPDKIEASVYGDYLDAEDQNESYSFR